MLQESFIKHGKIYSIDKKQAIRTHLGPIKELVTRGIADAHESITLQPKACDIKGAKRHNGQHCVIAKALQRTLHPQAVAVGRSLAYVVVEGLAIRFIVPKASRKLIEEFDQRGKASVAPVTLSAVNPTWKMSAMRARRPKKQSGAVTKRARTKSLGVRAIGGGISSRASG